MKKIVLFAAIYFFISFTIPAASVEHNYVLGFSGLYLENSWTPVLLRLANEGPSLSGKLVISADNSNTSTEQKREYNKPIDLASGSRKEISFVIPIGHHTRSLTYYLELSDGSRVFEEVISLKQKGVKERFVLGISPFPDLGFLHTNKFMAKHILSYPHIDNLPENSNAYDSVDIISIHREYLDRLRSGQYEAITEWVARGGVLAVWGGKSPSPSNKDILPLEISGLKNIDSIPHLSAISDSTPNSASVTINLFDSAKENILMQSDEYKLVSKSDFGNGSVFFTAFDYSGTLKNWQGISAIWTNIFERKSEIDQNFTHLNDQLLLEDFIKSFDLSGFHYMDRINVGLILFLSASISISLLIFIHLRRNSNRIPIYIGVLMVSLIIPAIAIYIMLFSTGLKSESYVISSNVIHQKGSSNSSVLYKNILIGSASRTESDIIIRNDDRSRIKREFRENIQILQNPEIRLQDISLERWSSQIFRLEKIIKSQFSFRASISDDQELKITVNNHSDSYMQNVFIISGEERYLIGNIAPGESIQSMILPGNGSDSRLPQLQEFIMNRYIAFNEEKKKLYLVAISKDELHPLVFSNKAWKKKSVNILIGEADV